MTAGDRQSRTTRGAILYFVIATAMLVAPCYPWLGNTIEPRVLGLPWSMVYVLLVTLANFGVLLGLYLCRAIDDREADRGEPR